MRIDAAAIAKVLQERGADDTMLQWVAATLTNQELPELVHLLGDMSDARVDDRERLVDAILLTLPANEALDNKSLQALQQIGGALGIGMRWFGARVEAELGLKLGELQALADLRLPREHSPEELKRAHERMLDAFSEERISKMNKGEAFAKAARKRRKAANNALKALVERSERPEPLGATSPEGDGGAMAKAAKQAADRAILESIARQTAAKSTAASKREAAGIEAARRDWLSKQAAAAAQRAHAAASGDASALMEEDETPKKRSALAVTGMVFGAISAVLIVIGLALLIFDPGLMKTMETMANVQGYLESSLVQAGLMSERLPPELRNSDPEERIAYLKSVADRGEATPVFAAVIRADESPEVRRAAYDHLVTRWETGVGDEFGHEWEVAAVMSADDPELRAAAQAQMRAKATTLSTLAEILAHDDLERRREGIAVARDVADRLGDNTVWASVLRGRIKQETDPGLRDQLRGYLNAIDADKSGTVPTKSRIKGE